MSNFRRETDLLGEREIPAHLLYGIHTIRAIENFPLSQRRVNPSLIHAFGAVKLACATTNHALGKWDEKTFAAISQACEAMMNGELDEQIVVDALQGGAGTSTNMNVNEVLANQSLLNLGEELGSYQIVHPIEDINLHQSTNDTYPTALKVAAIGKLRILERKLVDLLEAFQAKEKEFSHVVKIGRTQTKDAVLTTMGRTMSSYAEAFGRDRWRVYKCEERLRVVNLGGTAIGTGLGAPRKYIFKVTENLKKLTGYGLNRAENLVEATQNQDVFPEVSGILKACAVNLMKCANDLRFMSSGPYAGINELSLPERQAGSSIMPDKVNPVIPEAVVQAAMVVMAHDSSIAQACAAGHLELNPFLPLVADALLESLDLLTNSADILSRLCVKDLAVNEKICAAHVNNSTATITALVDIIGYDNAREIARKVTTEGIGIREAVIKANHLSGEEFDQLVSQENVMKLGSK